MSAAAEADASVAARERRVFLRQLHSRAAARRWPTNRAAWFCRKIFASKIGLKGEVALVGGRGRFEIWNVHALETRPRGRNADLSARRQRHRIVGAKYERIAV